jgi:CRP-like cAMP-binding protein
MTEIELRESALFSEMDHQEVAEIRAIMDKMKFKPGQTIIHEGELGNLFYVIMAGEVQVTIHDADGKDVVLQELGQNRT